MAVTDSTGNIIELSAKDFGDTFALSIDKPQIKVIVGDNLQGSVLCQLRSESIKGPCTIELEVGAGTELTWCQMNYMDADTLEIAQSARIGKNSHVAMVQASFGGSDVRHLLTHTLTGEGGCSDIDWIFAARGTEKQKFSVRNIFEAPNCTGEILMKGIAEEKAHTAANGMIEIGLQGRGTDAYLTQDVLMLDSTAKVDAIPGLEIKTNDVKASHSATVSRVTVEDLFYFASRGIPTAEARRMYIEGFLLGVAEKYSIPVKEALSVAVQDYLERVRN